jgi:hypothetical protein
MLVLHQLLLMEVSMAALIRQLALVSESKLIPHSDVLKVSAAIQKQATRDLGPIWDVAATIDAFETLEDVPVGYWPMRVMDDIQVDGAAGIHEDKDGQPFALITASSDLNTWSLTTSHEAFEMLVDPFGNRVIASDSPKSDQGRVSILVEVCDPSEAADYAYSVNGILVSDFYTPNFFDPVKAPGVRYSYTGALTAPRQVLSGGYLSWQDAASGHWWQEIWFGTDQPTFRDLGQIDQKVNGNIRAVIDRNTMVGTMQAIARGRNKADAAGLTVAAISPGTTTRAAMWRDQTKEILESARKGSPDQAGSGRRSAPQVGKRR